MFLNPYAAANFSTSCPSTLESSKEHELRNQEGDIANKLFYSLGALCDKAQIKVN